MAFGNRPETNQKAVSTSFLGKGTFIDGKFQVEGNIRIDGNFKGEVDGNADLIIGEGAYIEATIKVRNLTVMGEVHGNITCSEKLEIHNTGKVVGEIKAGKLIIEENAIFEGSSLMHTKKEDKAPSMMENKTTQKQAEVKKIV
jgi:cytoskeletal protein CcmA (bactofilin family)